ncbi:MAG: hypothetical protein RLZZ127_328 [Planctomycetota bacterium]|jgi:hypothetical protein
MRIPLLLTVVSVLAAADPTAIRADGSPAAAGEPIASGAATTAFTLAGAPLARFQLAPGSTASVSIDAAGRAVVDLGAGAVEADIDGRGPYPAIVVRGAAMEVAVTGTLFVVQRVRRDADYVALLQGRVTVGLRQEVLAMLGRDVPALELTDRQGVGASFAGFDQVETLTGRPSLTSTAPIRDQVVGDPGPASGPGDLPSAVPGLGDLPPVAPEGNRGPGDLPAVPDPIPDPGQITQQVVDRVVDQISEQISEQITEQISDQVVEQIVEPTLPPLAGPPPTP